MAITTRTPPAEALAQPSTTNLELFHYSRFVREDVLYEKGRAYKFTDAQAQILLDEVDDISGMPIWKCWKPLAKRVVVEREVQPTDMTATSVTEAPPSDDPAKRVDIGSDDEIAHLLHEGDEGSGAVNV